MAAIADAALPTVVSLSVSGDDGQGTGSGFVLRDDGYILTNNHVISGAASGGRIVVTFSDGDEVKGTIVGRSASYDLGVVKVDRRVSKPRRWAIRRRSGWVTRSWPSVLRWA